MADTPNKVSSNWWSNFSLFGFRFKDDIRSANTASETVINPSQKTFALPVTDDGAVMVQSGAYYGTYVDLDGSTRNEVEQITKYREIAQQAEVEGAVNNIVNEAICRDESGQCVNMIMDELEQPDVIKERIKAEFDGVLNLLNFGNLGPDIFRRWFIDGRLYYHKVVDEKNMGEGIKELRFIDPRKIRKVKEVFRQKDPKTGLELIKEIKEYYLFNELGILGTPTNLGAKIAVDSIAYIPSGLLDARLNNVLSYLQKAIKPINQLRMVEDALVIYRLARAPERRCFYVDVGNMPTQKAQQYIAGIMTKYKNKLVYDATTGEIRDDRRHLSMLEDFWLPRREGSKGTEIVTLPGGENLGRIEDVEYFLKKLYKSLDVPISRLEPQTGFTIGRSAEITRDELSFMKFVDRLRIKFSQLFDDVLKTQLLLKNICTEDDWAEFRQNIFYDFLKDNNFTELKDQELWRERFGMVAMIDPYVGKYVSVEWLRKNILRFTEDEIVEIDEQCEAEMQNPRFMNPMLNGGMPLGGGGPVGFGGPGQETPPFGGQPPGQNMFPNAPGKGNPQQDMQAGGGDQQDTGKFNQGSGFKPQQKNPKKKFGGK